MYTVAIEYYIQSQNIVKDALLQKMVVLPFIPFKGLCLTFTDPADDFTIDELEWDTMKSIFRSRRCDIVYGDFDSEVEWYKDRGYKIIERLRR
jgi:hypothetical protein